MCIPAILFNSYMVNWFIFQCFGFWTENCNNILTNLMGIGKTKWINAYTLKAVSKIQEILAVSLLIIYAEAEFYFFFSGNFLIRINKIGLLRWERRFLSGQLNWSHHDPQVSLCQNNYIQGFTFPWGRRVCYVGRESWGREVGWPWEFHWKKNCFDGYSVFCSTSCSGLRMDFRPL